MKNILLIFILSISIIYFEGCLTIESKEYTFELDKGLSGHGSIKFINILSVNKDSIGTIETDYSELMDSYYKGDKIKEELSGVKNLKKRLYEEDNQLCGEVSFDFDDISKLKFYKYKDKGPWCYYLSILSMGLLGGTESYFASNGTYGGDNMPIIFWDEGQKEFNFKTAITSPGKSTISLLQMWKEKGEN